MQFRGAASRRGGRRAALALACVLGAAATKTLGAQGLPRTQARCAGQIITDVAIRTHAPDYGGLFSRERSTVLEFLRPFRRRIG